MKLAGKKLLTLSDEVFFLCLRGFPLQSFKFDQTVFGKSRLYQACFSHTSSTIEHSQLGFINNLNRLQQILLSLTANKVHKQCPSVLNVITGGRKSKVKFRPPEDCFCIEGQQILWNSLLN